MKSGFRYFCFICASLLATQVFAADMSGWSDKTVCRLVKSDGDADYLDEATNRGLDCKAKVKEKNNLSWSISCGVDNGSMYKKNGVWTFKPSKNKCPGGVFEQRAELNTKKMSINKKVKYSFFSSFNYTGISAYEFSVFSVHDGRDGCAPPLQIFVGYSGDIYLTGDYKIGTGENCRRDILKTVYYGNQRVNKNGDEQTLRVDLDFNGKGAFGIEVFLNNILAAKSSYAFEEGKGYMKSPSFYFKHGVYSRFIFDYEMQSKFSMGEASE
jgi:hypothetical protein